MKTACTVCAFAVALLVANSVVAAPQKAGKVAGVHYFQTIDNYLKPVTLTEDQQSKLEALKKEYEPKFKEAYAKRDVLTPEQKKAGEDAKQAAKAEGKKRQEVKDAVVAAEKWTDEQKSKRKEASQQLRLLENEMHGKVKELLTADQKAQIKAAKPKKSSKPAKADTASPATAK